MKKLYPTLILALSFLITSSLWSQGTVTATYTSGDIPSDRGFTSLGGASTCAGQLDVVIPAGDIVTSVDVAYDMTAGGGAWMSEQKSWIYCSSTAIGEAAVAGGAGAGAGTINYSRTGLTIADGASGTVSFEMHAGRTWGGSGCGTNYNKIDDGTWTITVNHGPVPSCFAPSSLTASNVIASSADISWTPSGSENSYTFEYGPTGYTQGSGTSTTLNASATIADNPNSLFVGGANATWSYIHPLVITTDGAASQAAQTYTINVTSLPAGGAKARLIKSTANGGAAFTPAATGQALVLGANTFTAAAVSFDRYVKIQFNNNAFEFDAISVNGSSVYSAASTSISGLSPSTTYDAWIQGDCGANGQSSWVGPLTFTTPCASLSVPFSEGFSAALPNCWTNSGAENWIFNTSGPNHVGNGGVLTGSTFSGGHYAVVDASGSEANAVLTSPVIDVSTLNTAELTFYLNSNNEGNPSSLLTVTANGNTIGTYTGNTNGWEQKSISLSSYTSTVQLEFIFTEPVPSSFYDDIAIDDIDVHETPNCLAASSLSSSNLTATSADLSWTGTSNSSGFNVEYGPDGFAPGSGTISTVNASSTISQSSLFTPGPAAWPYVYSIVTTSDGAASQAAQSFSINVTSLPTGGANFRLIKQTANGGAAFQPNGTGQALVLGLNTFTAAAVNFNRYVKIQFDNGGVEFDAMSANGVSVYSPSLSLSGLSPSTTYQFYVQNDCGAGGLASPSTPSSFTTLFQCPTGAECVVGGSDIPTEYGYSTATATSTCPGTFSVTIPTGDVVDSVSISYDMIAGGGAWMSEQKSWLYCSTTSTGEAAVSSGAGAGAGSFSYSRNGLTFANFASGIVNFELHAGRTWGGSGCGTSYNRVDGSSIVLTVYHSLAPSCTPPSAFTLVGAGATSAIISWNRGGTETNSNYEFGPPGFTPGTGTGTSGSTTFNQSVGFGPLNPQTQYDVYVQADCGSAVSSWTGPLSFTTPCNTYSLQASNNLTYFEDLNSGLPGCMTTESTTGPGFQFTGNPGYNAANNGATSGTYAWIDFSGTDAGAILNLQKIEATPLNGFSQTGSHNLAITFDLFNDPGTYSVAPSNYLLVEQKIPDFVGGNSWVVIDSITTTVGWETITVAIPQVSDPGGNTYVMNELRLRAESGNSPQDFYSDILVDNITVGIAPSCLTPSAITSSNVTNSSVDLSWIAGGTETAWNYEYGPTGFTQGSGTSAPVNSASATLSGLTSLTSYDVYVQADCGSGDFSGWAGPVTFSTIPNVAAGVTCTTPGASSQVIFSDDFESNVTTWTGDANWEITGGNGATSSNTGPSNSNIHSGSGIMNFEASTTALTHQGSKYSPPIDLSGGFDDAELSFWMHGYGSTMGTFEVAVGSTLAGAFTTVFTTTGQTHASGTSPWWNIGVDLSSYVGQTIYLKFTMIDNQGGFQGDMSIDLVEVSTCLSCSDPSALLLDSITTTTASISWTGSPSASSYNFEYGPTGFTQGTGNTGVISGPSFLIDSLTANTSYQLYVQSDCGAIGLSNFTGPYTFVTLCDLLTTFPYTMGFENGFDCWDQLDVDGGNSWGLVTAEGIGGSVAAAIQYNASAHDDHLISPKFSVTANSTRFSFNASDYFGYPESFEVLVSTTGKSAADFTDTISSEVASGGYSYYQYDLSSYIGQDVYVSIHSTSTDQYYLFVDDVTIDEYVSKTIIESETSCDSYTWSVNGTSYISDTSLTVFSPAVDVADADSTFILNLTVNSSTSITETITACDSLQWYGNTYFASNSTATHTLQTSLGCDSVVILNLTINNSAIVNETANECDSYTWNGNTYTSSGNYSYSDTTVNGCDSTVNLVLTLNSSSSSLLTTTACNTFTWKGLTLDSSGVYVAPVGTNFSGCPQVDSLDLTITTIATSDTQTACDSYIWNGNTYTTSGTYYSSSACVDTLYLTVNASSSSSSTVAACDSSVWNGLTYFTSGTYNVFTTNATGCDSTATLNLTVGNSATNSVTVSECDSYNWAGNTYTSSGVYSNVFQSSTGCDSTVNLVLTINSSSNQSVTVFSCDEYVWDGVSYTSSGDYTNNYTSASGCDSTVTLVLTLGTTAAPFTEGFDINFPNCWSQPDSADGEDDLDWTRNSFATFSPGTGPSDDVIGGGHYMYIESSLPAQHGDNAIMYSNFIDISSLTNPELRFFSHMYGESTGSLTVEIQGENDTVPTTIFSKSGDHGDLWVQERVTFSSTSNRVKFKITGILDSNSLGAVWAGDMAIDEFGVREAVPNDLAIIAAAVNSDCELTTTEPIELWVVNNGLVDQANFKLSYSINGGAPVLDSIIQFVNIGDTLRHTFTATADMSMDGIYDIDFECILAIDADATDNVLNFVAENYTTPADAVTEGDTICFVGDFGQVSALGDGWIYWYDSLVGGSLVGENDTLSVTPSATTSYFAEVSVYDGFEEDFESYTPGDLIAQSSNDWNTWSDPNGGADDDAEVTDFVSAGGSNSLYLNDDYSDDIVLPLGNTYSSGTFNFETDMYIETNAYLNFQEGVVNGEAWAFDIYFNDTTINVEIDDSTVLTVAYNPNNPLGAPVWFNFSLQADLDNGQWKMFKDGVSLGSFAMNDEISSVNFWASTGNDYYIDNVKWGAWGGEACRSLSRTEAVVVLDSCNTTSVSEVSFENLKIYPNPNNGSFTIANSELINSVVIMDLQGKVVYRNSNLNLYNLNVNLENLDRGMYMINIISENEIITKSIIVN